MEISIRRFHAINLRLDDLLAVIYRVDDLQAVKIQVNGKITSRKITACKIASRNITACKIASRKITACKISTRKSTAINQRLEILPITEFIESIIQGVNISNFEQIQKSFKKLMQHLSKLLDESGVPSETILL